MIEWDFAGLSVEHDRCDIWSPKEAEASFIIPNDLWALVNKLKLLHAKKFPPTLIFVDDLDDPTHPKITHPLL